MKVLVAGLVTGLGILGIATTAEASTFFKLDQFDVNLNDTDPGLRLQAKKLLNTPIEYTLEVGKSKTIELFKLWTNEGYINSDDLEKKPISVDFHFSSPELFSNSVNGETFGKKIALPKTFFGSIELQKGKVKWDGPSLFNFGNGGELEVSLSDEFFNSGINGTWGGKWLGAAVVEATFTLNKDSEPVLESETVPEPASAAVFLGIGFLGAASRLKRYKVA